MNAERCICGVGGVDLETHRCIPSLEKRVCELQLEISQDEHLYEELRAHAQRLEARNAELYEALKAMLEFWAYGLAKEEGAIPTPEDDARIEQLAILAGNALAKAEGKS